MSHFKLKLYCMEVNFDLSSLHHNKNVMFHSYFSFFFLLSLEEMLGFFDIIHFFERLIFSIWKRSNIE
jgi:hypothetical protein